MIFLLVYLGTSMLKKHVCETGKYLSAFPEVSKQFTVILNLQDSHGGLVTPV